MRIWVRMHHLLCFLCLFFLLAPAEAQTFEADPTVLEQEIYFELANEAIINFDNLGFDTLQLRWKLLSEDFPSEWNVALCDYGLCYEGIPLSGLMNPAPSPEKPFLKLVILPEQHPGVGTAVFRVYNHLNPSEFLDVTFQVNTPGASGDNAYTAEIPKLTAFPNPAYGQIHLRHKSHQTMPFEIFDASGFSRIQGLIPNQQTYSVDLNGWPAGLYSIRTAEQTLIFIILTP